MAKKETLTEITEREFMLIQASVKQAYVDQLKEVYNSIQTIEELKELGYVVKFYRTGNGIKYTYQEPEKIGFHQ